MLDLSCPSSEGWGPEVEKYAISRAIWLSVLISSSFTTHHCGPRPGTTPDPVEPASHDLPAGTLDDHSGETEESTPGMSELCPSESEDSDECPDDDGDGILDGPDQCPLLAEEMNGVDDLDGCPDLARIEGCQIVVTEKVHYKGDPSAAISPKSFATLDIVAEIIKSNPDLGVIRIEVHSGPWGDDYYNMVLTEDRALQVMEYLVKKGVPEESLIAIGCGEEKPIASNDTEEGRAMNQRTEFHIVGCEEE
jgi:outer membrane protein OmpA-like peptidoglycan-associated protein